MPGWSSEKNVAAGITPAAPLNIASCARADGFGTNRIQMAPTTVPRPARAAGQTESEYLNLIHHKVVPRQRVLPLYWTDI